MPPAYAKRTGSSTSPATVRRTCCTRSGSSAASTARARRSRRRASPQDDDIAQFIARIERTDKAFQRQLSRAKVRALRNFYETAVTQPPIPGDGAALHRGEAQLPLVATTTSAISRNRPAKFFIIDGQHRLAALQFYLRSHPDEATTINVPCVIFDGRSEDFATEMFVIINSTPDAHQQEPPRRPVRARVVGRARPALRRAHRREALQRGRQPAALPHQPARRAQPAGQVDPAGRALQRDPPLGAQQLAEDPGRGRRRRARPSATTTSSATSSRPRERRWGDATGATRTTWSPSR